jgi:hypothetical protein
MGRWGEFIMATIAKALVMAIQFIAEREGDEDDDVHVLEQLASLLQQASIKEQKLLIKVANESGYADLAEHLGLDS